MASRPRIGHEDNPLGFVHMERMERVLGALGGNCLFSFIVITCHNHGGLHLHEFGIWAGPL